MDNVPDIELEPQQGVSEGSKVRRTRRTAQIATPTTPQGGATGNFIQNLKLRQKLSFIVLALALPIAALLYLLVSEQNEAINFAQKERRGVEYLEPSARLFPAFWNHISYSGALLSGDTSLASLRVEQAAKIDLIFADIAKADTQYGVDFGTTDDLAALQQAWNSYKANFETLSPAESSALQIDLLDDILNPLILEAGNASNLILDPDLDSYYVMDLVVNKLPAYAVQVTRLRELVASAIARGTLSDQQQASVAVRYAETFASLEEVEASVEFILAANPALAPELTEMAEQAALVGRGLLEGVDQGILQANTTNITVSRADFAEGVEQFIVTFNALYNRSLVVLDNLLETRIGGFRQEQLLSLLITAVALILAVLLVILIARQITRPLEALSRLSKRVGQGDLSQLAQVSSNDEIGTLANTLNGAVLQLREVGKRNEEEREQSAQLQTNVSAFLDVAMDIAEGDFTKRGNVTEDVLGNIVDAINLMVEEVAYLLTQTQDAALSVNSGAAEMIATTQAIAQSAQRQASQAQRARAETEQVTLSIRKMAAQADASASASTKALLASRQGEAAVQNTLKGMQGIRSEVQSISERTKSLTKRSDEISGIVRSMSRIASQTNLLALSASLEAAGAGEAGTRFATVANEVQTLAEESANAARQVAGIVRELQSDIREVAELTESGSHEVEAGYQVASEAGQRLREIAEISGQSAELARLISQATQEQVQGVVGVNEVVQAMAEISQASQGSVSGGRDAAEKLQALAAQLTEGLSRFRLAS